MKANDDCTWLFTKYQYKHHIITTLGKVLVSSTGNLQEKKKPTTPHLVSDSYITCHLGVAQNLFFFFIFFIF
jgi:hypothetical protein